MKQTQKHFVRVLWLMIVSLGLATIANTALVLYVGSSPIVIETRTVPIDYYRKERVAIIPPFPQLAPEEHCLEPEPPTPKPTPVVDNSSWIAGTVLKGIIYLVDTPWLSTVSMEVGSGETSTEATYSLMDCDGSSPCNFVSNGWYLHRIEINSVRIMNSFTHEQKQLFLNDNIPDAVPQQLLNSEEWNDLWHRVNWHKPKDVMSFPANRQWPILPD